MSDLEEVSDSELNDKIEDDSPFKLNKKKQEYDSDEEEKDSEEEEKDSGDEDEEKDSEDDEKDIDIELDEEQEPTTKAKLLPINLSEDEEEDDEEDEEEDDYLQKFDKNVRSDFISRYHPESKSHNYEEIKALSRVSRNSSGIVSDVLHKTLPFLTKYEMTRVLGQRARQINAGAKIFVVVPPNVLDGYLIAKMELEQKKMPFIIKRPLPNGGFEYWNVSDLELI